MSESDVGTYFYRKDGQRLGSESGIIPITLFKGMQITIHGYEEAFEVVDWNYHHGHVDEEAGLRIILEPSGKKGEWGVFPFRI